MNPKTGQSLESCDVCSLADWAKAYSTGCACCMHPAGFPVFIPPSEIDRNDEYRIGDPYTVEQNLDSEFHQRRFNSTLHLIDRVAAGTTMTRILDIGCGEGYITSHIEHAYPGAHIFGMDYSVTAIERAATAFPNISFAAANAYTPPYAESYFDAVICNNLWEHVPDPVHLASCICRILRPGGYLIISTPSRYRIGNLARIVQGKPVSFMSSQHVTEYSVGQVVEQLQHAGMSVVERHATRISTTPNGIKEWCLLRLFAPIARLILTLAGRSESAESTVFYLAQRISLPA